MRAIACLTCVWQLKRVTVVIPKLEVDISKTRMVHENSDTRIAELTARQAELSSKAGPSDEEELALQAMQKRLIKQESLLTKAVAAASRLEGEISELQKKVLEAGGTRLKQAKAKAEQANTKLNDAVRRDWCRSGVSTDCGFSVTAACA